MNKITIRYSHDNHYPWRVFDVTNNIIYHSKKIKMDGIFNGVSFFESFTEIEAFGHYERSDVISVKKSKYLNKNSLLSHVMEIDEITVYGQNVN